MKRIHTLLCAVVCALVSASPLAQVTPFKTINVGNDAQAARIDVVNDKVFVNNFGSDTVSVISPLTYAVTGTIATGDGPRRMAINSTTEKLYVVNSNGAPNVSSVTVINVVNNAIITTIPLAGAVNARNLTIDETLNKIYVFLRDTGQVAVIDGSTDTLQTTVTVGGQPIGGCTNPVTGKVYIANFLDDTVSVINGATNAVSAPVSVGDGPNGCGVDTSTNRIFVTNQNAGTVSVIDGATDTVSGLPLTVGAGPSFGALNTVRNVMVILNGGTNTVTLFRLDTLVSLGTIVTGTTPFLAFIDQGVFALHVTNQGSGTVSIIDLHTNAVAQTITVGNEPQWVARYFNNFYIVNSNGTGASTVSVYKRFNFTKGADISNDGKSDLLWNNTATKVNAGWVMDGAAITSSSDILGGSDWIPVLENDLDGDGAADIVWRNTTTNATAVWLMNGLVPKPGPTGNRTILGPSPFVPLYLGSYDGNSNSDLVWRDPTTGAVAIWLMNGVTPLLTQQIFSGPNTWLPIQGNFNGDFHTDLLWYNSATGESAIWLMHGDSISGLSYTGASIMPAGAHGWVPIFTGDFDGDGKADIVWQNSLTGNTAVWLMDGLTPKPGGQSEILAGASGWRVARVRDLDADLKSDLIFRNLATGATAVWLMDGLAIKSSGTILNDANWVMVDTFDTNNDLKGDLLWRNSATGATALWLMNGLTQIGGGTILTDANWVVVPPPQQ